MNNAFLIWNTPLTTVRNLSCPIRQRTFWRHLGDRVLLRKYFANIVQILYELRHIKCKIIGKILFKYLLIICMNIVKIFSNYSPNIFYIFLNIMKIWLIYYVVVEILPKYHRILSKYSPNIFQNVQSIVQIMSKYCPNNVQILSKYFLINYKIFGKYRLSNYQILS